MRRSSEVLLFLLARILIAGGILFVGVYIAYQTVALPPGDAGARLGQNLGETTPTFEEWVFGIDGEGGIVRGDYGMSFATSGSAYERVAERGEATLELLVAALVISISLGTGLGALAAGLGHYIADFILRPVGLLLVAAPVFWVAVLLIMELGMNQRLLPLGSRCGITQESCPEFFNRLEYVAMPLMALCLVWTAGIALLTRQAVVSLFRARQPINGSGTGALLLAFPALVGGVLGSLVLVESVFAWPGVGRLLVESLSRADYPVIMAILVPVCALIAVVTLVTGLLYLLFAGFVRRPLWDTHATAIPFLLGVFPSRPRQNVLNRVVNTVLALVALVVIIGAIARISDAQTLTRFDPTRVNPAARLLPPGSEGHVFGTDELGRDVYARLLYGGATTITIALMTAVYALIIGGIVGATGGLLYLAGGVRWGKWLNLPVDVYIGVAGGVPALFISLALITWFLAARQPATAVETFLLPLAFGVLVSGHVAAAVRAAFLPEPSTIAQKKRAVTPRKPQPAPAATTSSSPRRDDTSFQSGFVSYSNEDVSPSVEMIPGNRPRYVDSLPEQPLTNALIEKIEPRQTPFSRQQTTTANGTNTGQTALRIIFRVALAAAYGFVISAAAAIVLETAVSFLGFGIVPPNASWGNMLSNSISFASRAPYLVIVPGALATAAVFALSLVAARLGDALGI
jgi:peptide/nickel transport system permease protein